jgi:uncharacterized protein YjiK
MSGTDPRSGLLLLVCTLAGSALLAVFGGKAEAVSRSAPDVLNPMHLAGEQRQVAAIGVDASGITWSDHRHSLFAVRNSLPQVTEMDSDGRVVRNIQLQGFKDVEGITWLEDDRFAVVEERTCTVWLLQLGEGVSQVGKPPQPLLSLPALNPDIGNNGCEDLAWDASLHVLYLLREKKPVVVVRVTGVNIDVPALGQPQVQLLLRHAETSALGSDISGMHFDSRLKQLFVLSDESQRITGIDTRDVPTLSQPFALGELSNGLVRGIPQPEGMTMDRNGNLYVLSEPDLLYKFVR